MHSQTFRTPFSIKNILLSISAIVLFALLFVILLYQGTIWLNNPDTQRFPVRGLDISNHQGIIVWSDIDTDKYKFVYIKATEGGNYKDKLFPANWEQSKKRGIYRGAYHFFTFSKSGKEQAANFIETVPVEPDTLPPVVDVEFLGNSSNRPSQAEFHTNLSQFIELVEKHYGKKPIIYTTYAFMEHYELEYDGYKLWIRDIFLYPHIPEKEWVLWQFSNRGKISGIQGFVDVNVFNGSQQELIELVK